MTKFQEIILLSIGIVYVIYSSKIIISYQEQKNQIALKSLILHHIPGYIGIAYMLYTHQCGGIIIRLSFDCVDYTLQLLNILTEKKYKEILNDLEEIAYFILRTCYYSILGIYGIYIMICYWNFIDKILFIFYTIWTLYYLYSHIYLGFYLKKRFILVEIYYKWIKGKRN